MKRMALVISILAMLGCMLTSVVHALPVLLTDQATKMKFTNFEKWIDTNNNNIFDAGDAFEGIFVVTTIGDYEDGITTWSIGGADELTGIFRISIINSTGNPVPGGDFHLDFALGDNDYFIMYYDTSPDWNPSAPDAVARASDGMVYMSVLPGAGPLNGSTYEGYNETTLSTAVNRNWAYLAENNTGYPIVPLQWPETVGQIDPHWYNGAFHPSGHVSDIFWETHLQTLINNPNWQYKSEDPLLLQPVPEPGTVLLLGIGLLGLGVLGRKGYKKG